MILDAKRCYGVISKIKLKRKRIHPTCSWWKAKVVSGELRLSGSHDPGETASNLMLFAECYLWICDMRMGGSGDETINKSHKCVHLIAVDGSFSYFLEP